MKRTRSDEISRSVTQLLLNELLSRNHSDHMEREIARVAAQPRGMDRNMGGGVVARVRPIHHQKGYTCTSCGTLNPDTPIMHWLPCAIFTEDNGGQRGVVNLRLYLWDKRINIQEFQAVRLYDVR
jgi:hypothetical protein